jgi:hypothetical protein
MASTRSSTASTASTPNNASSAAPAALAAALAPVAASSSPATLAAAAPATPIDDDESAKTRFKHAFVAACPYKVSGAVFERAWEALRCGDEPPSLSQLAGAVLRARYTLEYEHAKSRRTSAWTINDVLSKSHGRQVRPPA